jgi:hypothetical protein
MIYPDNLEIKNTTESYITASYLDILLKIDSNGRPTTTLYDKHEDFNFAIVNFPFLWSNIPLLPVYDTYIFQLIRHARACLAYENLLKRNQLLTKNVPHELFRGKQVNVNVAGLLQFSFKVIILQVLWLLYNDLVCNYKLSLNHMLKDLFHTLC